MRSRWRDNAYTVEEQLSRLRQQIEELEAELIDREAELVDLRVELSAFRLEYDTRVGRKVEELEAIEEQIKRCKQRISEYRQWGAGGLPKTSGGETYVPVEEQYRRTWQEPEAPQPFPFAPPMNPVTEAQIKTLYRQLCRRFHPDLRKSVAPYGTHRLGLLSGEDEGERAWRTEMMAAINAAYAARSLTELQALARKPDYASTKISTDRQRLGALRDKMRQIQRRLREVEQEIYDLTHSQTMEVSLSVKLARRKGRDLLVEMAADAEEDLERKQVELDFMMAQLKQLGITLE